MRCETTSSVEEYALRARSTHGVHHAIVKVNIVIGVMFGEVLVARVVPLVVDAVVGLTLCLIAHVVVVVFVVATLHRIFWEIYSLHDPEDQQIGMPSHAWQQAETDAAHSHLVEGQVRPRMSAIGQAILRSQGGPLSGVLFSCFPTSALSRFDSSQIGSCSSVISDFPMLLATTVQLVLKLGCWVVWFSALQSEVARVYREVGARVGTSILGRDLDLVLQGGQDSLWLEMVVDELPLIHARSIVGN